MSKSRIMVEIRALLAEEKSVKEIISLGYKPSSVYRAQQQLLEGSPHSDLPLLQGLPHVVVNNNMEANLEHQVTSALKEKYAHLVQQLSVLEEQVTELDSTREELTQAKALIEELKPEASQARLSREQLAVLELEAQASDKARKQSQELEGRLSSTNVELGQKVQEWQGRCAQEQQARQQAQALAHQSGAEADRLKEANQQLQQRIEQLPREVTQVVWKSIQPMLKELEELRECWVGHPCAGCGKPTPGVTSRKEAGTILREARYGHSECLKKCVGGDQKLKRAGSRCLSRLGGS